MAEKKGLFASLFGAHSGGCCNMEITEGAACCCSEAEAKKEDAQSKKGGRDTEIVGEDK